MKMSDDQKRDIMDALAETLITLTNPGTMSEKDRVNAASAIRMVYYLFETDFRGGR